MGRSAAGHFEPDGIEQLRADADEIARRFAASNIVDTVSAIMRGAAQLLSGDLEGSDASFEDAVSIGKATGATDMLAVALCERSLLAMTRGEWDQAEVFAGQARTFLRRGGMADSYVTPLVCAVHARAAMHRGDVATARQELTAAQRQRHLLTYAIPKVAVQARIELARVHIALADPTGARTLMREVNDLLRLRPGLGTLVGQAEELRVQLSRQRGSIALGASALTDAELRLLPLLATYLSFPEIADDLSLSRSTVKVEAISIYQKLGVSSRSQAVAQARRLGLLD